MTGNELNRQVNQLFGYHTINSNTEAELEIIKREGLRLYSIDKSFAHLSKRSLLQLMYLNSKYRFVEPFRFIMFVNEENLI